MAKLPEPLEYLAERGIRIQLGGRKTKTILVGSNDEYGACITPGQQEGLIGIVYVTEERRAKGSKLLWINVTGWDHTQIAFTNRPILNIYHTKKASRKALDFYDVTEVSRQEYDERVGGEMGLSF